MTEPIYNKEYHIWREEAYLGTATFIYDHNIGDAFVKLIHTPDKGIVTHVFEPDRFELVDLNNPPYPDTN